jgi:site-specific DNA-cytosine methylase
MRYGSVCSGIEAASVAWHPLGWEPAWFAEIEAFPSAVLKHHYPSVPNLGDMTALPARIRAGEVEAPDVLVGGTPCQAFSVAGLRQSLADQRGNLSLTFCEIADAIDDVRRARGDDPAIIVWENVPGVLSTKDNAFGCFLGALAGEDDAIGVAKWPRAGVVDGRGRRVAWCVLDAQFFGLAQRRRRVFVVAVPCELVERLGDRADPAEILSLGNCLRRDTPTRPSSREVSPTIPSRSTAGGGLGTDFDCDGGVVEVCPTLRAGGNRTGGDRPPGTDVDTADSLIPCWWDGGDVAATITTKSDDQRMPDKANAQRVMQPVGVTIHGTDKTARVASYTEVAGCLRADVPGRIENSSTTVVQQPVPFDTTQITSAANYSRPQPGDPCHPLAAGAHPPAIAFHPTQDPISSTEVSHALNANANATAAVAIRTANTSANGHGISPELAHTLDQAQGQAVAVALRGREGGATAELGDEVGHALRASSGGGDKPHVLAPVAVAMAFDTYNQSINEHTSQTIKSPQGAVQESVGAVLHAMQVRRLTPEECEALQGFPRSYTAIPWRGKPAAACPDGPRYKALGNSMAVPVMRWIGERIAAVEAIREEAAA